MAKSKKKKDDLLNQFEMAITSGNLQLTQEFATLLVRLSLEQIISLYVVLWYKFNQAGYKDATWLAVFNSLKCNIKLVAKETGLKESAVRKRFARLRKIFNLPRIRRS